MHEHNVFFKNKKLASCTEIDPELDEVWKIDEADRRLVNLLQHDGRMSFSRLAADAGISRAAATRRVRRLIRRGVIAVVVATDLLRLGFLVRTVLCRVEEGGRRLAARRLAALPEVTYCILGAGSADIQLEIACSDTEHLGEVLESIAATPGVRILQSFEFLELVKQSYGWHAASPED
jgi:Lrp/AsnC family transcriptional regulator for asnA, asnC and gidA